MNRWNAIVCFISVGLVCIPGRVESQESALYSIGLDGSGLKIEVEAGFDPELKVYGSPDVSPDGERVVFDAYERVGFARFARILVLHCAGDSKGQIDDFDCGNCPVWSPDGQKIAFEVCAMNPLSLEPGVWMMNADGTEPERLSDGEQPRWFPDGKSVISTLLSGGVQLLKVDLKTKKATPFLAGFQHQGPIRFSRDGTRVLLHVQRNGKSQLISVAANGAEESIVQLSDAALEHPIISPDGKLVAFTTRDAIDGEIIQIVSADGRGESRKLVFASKVAKQDLCWHPNGLRILFTSNQKLLLEPEKSLR